MISEELRIRSAGRCECTGECGENHAWEAGLPAQRCRVPAGCNIQRKRGHLSWWLLASTQQVPIAYPEYYLDRIETVSLAEVKLPKGPKLLCGYCRSRPPIKKGS